VPIEARFEEGGLVTVIVTGTLDRSEAEASAVELLEDPRWRELSFVIWDLREARVFWEGEDVKALVNLILARRGTGRLRAAAVTPKDLEFGLARMYGALIEKAPVEFRVFRDMEEARTWILGPS
jgi:hypothetical protein